MSFLRQIKSEIRSILKSRFLLIIAILVVASSVVLPVISSFVQRNISDGGGIVRPLPVTKPIYSVVDIDIAYPEMSGQEPLVIDGITITADNPFYWHINGLMQEKNAMELDKGRFSDLEVLDLTLSLIDQEIKYYALFAQHITSHADYRMELAWTGTQKIYEKFIYEHNDLPEDKLMEAVSYRMGLDPDSFKDKYINITPEQKLEALDKLEEELNAINKVLVDNDFPQYINLRIQQEEDRIADLKEQIAIHEESIIQNPSQEESLNIIIEDLKRSIEMIETNTIPTLQLRLEKNIIPGEDTWENRALSDIEMYRNQLLYTEIISEEEFNKERHYVLQYGSYDKYLRAMQAQIDEYNTAIMIGERSLDKGKPDMKFVPQGSRNRTVEFLRYSIFVSMFAVLLGGWAIASEFQHGTIRLLMIRPKTRTKILMAKFIAALTLSLAVYVLGSLLNLITNGILFGFSDYAYPNYTISGDVNFFAYYVPKLIACTVSIIFAFAVAFMLSVVIKNVAVAIAVPIASFIGFNIVMATFTYSEAMNWLAYTPIPYVQISSFFTQNTMVKYAIQRGVPLSLSYGIILLLVLSAICTFISVYIFKRRDITD
ncbi:MAG: ABC transporter permease subunit [Clostridiales bacterium]|nr:ABC transporter permease subunit [Clostridiales bacterium]